MKKLIIGTLATTAFALTLPVALFADQGSAAPATADTSTPASMAHTGNTDPSGHTGGASADEGSSASVSGTSASAVAQPVDKGAGMPDPGSTDSSSAGTAAVAHSGGSDPSGHTGGASANQTGTNTETSK